MAKNDGWSEKFIFRLLLNGLPFRSVDFGQSKEKQS
jgi:hypothetical protein